MLSDVEISRLSPIRFGLYIFQVFLYQYLPRIVSGTRFHQLMSDSYLYHHYEEQKFRRVKEVPHTLADYRWLLNNDKKTAFGRDSAGNLVVRKIRYLE